MLLRYKTFLSRVPPQQGIPPIKNWLPFDEESEKRSILLMLGINPETSDEQLEHYKTAFAPTFADILSDDLSETPVLEYIDLELKAKKSEIDRINKDFEDLYNAQVELWKNGATVPNTVMLSNDPVRAEQEILDYEKSDNFVEWVDEWTVDEIDIRNTILEKTKYEVKLGAAKVSDKFILYDTSNPMTLLEIQKLAEENNMEFCEVSVDEVPEVGDDVLSIFQFYTYIDSQRENKMDALVDIVTDRVQTDVENEYLVPNAENLPLYAGRSRVEKFDADNVFDQLDKI